MKTLKKIIQWLLFTFMLFMALGCAALSAPIATILFIITGIFCSPLGRKIVDKIKPGIKSIYIVVLAIILTFTSCGVMVGTADTSSNTTTQSTEFITDTEEIETVSEISYENDDILNISEPIENEVSEVINEVEETTTEKINETKISDIPNSISELQVHFIDVGQGDSTLIICGSEAMLIDAGDNNQGTKVQNYLQKQGVETLKYVICTHPDADHIGGMDVILYKFDCDTIFMTEEKKDTNTYRDVIDTMTSKNYQSTLPAVGGQYSLGDAEFTILAPSKLDSDSNNNSITIILTHGENKFLFTGDAEEIEEQDILNNGISIDADVYKVGHHGSSSSSSERLLEAASPTYAVISCGEDNSYGHPHAETLNSLRAMGVQVFRTDEQGSIIATSDGTTITWNCAPSETWKAGESTQNSESTQNTENNSNSGTTSIQTTDENYTEPVEVPEVVNTPSEVSSGTTYICNTNTGKFHYPSCSSVDQMSEKNKLTVTTTRNELINQGYVPCKRCNP